MTKNINIKHIDFKYCTFYDVGKHKSAGEQDNNPASYEYSKVT